MSLSGESSTTDVGLLSCGLFEDELEELLQTRSPKVCANGVDADAAPAS